MVTSLWPQQWDTERAGPDALSENLQKPEYNGKNGKRDCIVAVSAHRCVSAASAQRLRQALCFAYDCPDPPLTFRFIATSRHYRAIIPALSDVLVQD